MSDYGTGSSRPRGERSRLCLVLALVLSAFLELKLDCSSCRSLTFADWKPAALDSSEVTQNAEVSFVMALSRHMHATGVANTKVWQGLSLTSGVLQEPTSPVTQQMLAKALLRTEYVIAEFDALRRRAHVEQQEYNSKINKLTQAREELQKAMEEQGKVRCQVILASLGLFFCVLQIVVVSVCGCAITHVT
jgi:hypothetical protein